MKNPILNVLKGLAIVLVVYGHVIQRSMVVAGQDFFAHPVFKIIYTFHVPLFFFVSGYLLAGSLEKVGAWEVFVTRCKSLLVPFIVWGLLGVLTSLFLGNIGGKHFYSFSFADLTNYLAGNTEVWFIWFLFTLFVCSALLIFSHYLKQRLGVVAFAGIYFCVLAIPLNEYCALYYIKWFYVFYLAGYFVNRCGAKMIAKLNHVAVLAISLVLFIIFASYWTKNDYIYVHKMNFWTANYAQEILRFVYRYFVGFLGIGIVSFFAAYLTKTKAGRILEYVGIYSLDIYLLQRYLVEGLYPRLLVNMQMNFDFYSPFFLWVFVPAVAGASILTCITISKLFFRKIPLVNILFLGNRI